MPDLKHLPLHHACVGLAVAALSAFGSLASAQTFPTRPITVVVPIAAGGSTDVITRLVTKHMSESLGQPIVVENITGAGGTIGAAKVAKAPADGYMLVAGSAGSQASAYSVYEKMPYTPDSFAQIGLTAIIPALIVVNKNIPANNIQEAAMISFGIRSHSESRRRPLNLLDRVFYKGEWMESGEDSLYSPTVFLAEQPPNCELTPHFHRQNQFQLFVEGEGSIGQERIGPVMVHYAGAYTGYGPILSGDAWLKYFTIRSVFDTGLTPTAQWREKMVRGPKRHAKASAGQPWTAEQLRALQGIQRETLIASDAGLGAELFRLPPNAAQLLLPIDGSVGQFVFVLAGTALVEGSSLSPWDSAFLPAPDGEVAIASGAQGAEVIALHMPETDAQYLAQAPVPAATESRLRETPV